MSNDFKRGIRIYLESSDYKKGIDDMVSATQKYEQKLEELTRQSEEMTAAGTNTGKAWKQLEKEIKKAESQVQKSKTAEGKYRQELAETQAVLDNLSGVSYNKLIKTRNHLSKELKNADQGTEKYNATLQQHKRVVEQIAIADGQMKGRIGSQESFFSRAAGVVNKYIGILATLGAAITGLSLTFRKMAEEVAKMDDFYADVMKTTNMTREEVLELNEEFKRMDTRTAREELNMLARDAGKLGITGKKDILDFVEAGNQIRVALGEDLGEDAIKSMGKMVGVFQKSTKELQGIDLKGQMLAAASAVNELGMSSTASEKYLVQFAGRLGGVSKQANIAMSDILGFASSLDQDMQAVEMSATALQKFIMKLMADPAKFAKMAGKDVKEFTALLQKDTNEAIKTVLRALNEKGGFQQLIPIFQEMGLDGARAVGVLSALAGSIDQVEEAQRIAQRAMAEGISVTQEYSIKNENLQAELDKARKRFKEVSLELGESLNPMLLKSTKGTTYLVKALVELPKWWKENKTLVLSLITILGTYSAIVARNTIITKANAAALKIQNSAFITTFKTLLKNPYAWIGVLIAGVTAAVYKLATSKTVAQKAMADFTAEAHKESTELNNIFSAYKKANEGTEEKRKLLILIKEKYGPYIQDLIDEKGNITDIEKAQRLANSALREQIALKIQNASINELMTDEMEDISDTLNTMREHIAKEKGNDIANIVIQEVGRIFNDNSNDLRTAYTMAWDTLRKYGLSPLLKRGIFSQSLASDLADIRNSYMKINQGTESIKANFAGIISTANDVAGIVTDTGTDDTDPKEPTVPNPEDKIKERLKQIDIWLLTEQNKVRARRIETNMEEKAFKDEMQLLEAVALANKMTLYDKDSKEYQELLSQQHENIIKGNADYYSGLLKALTDSHKAQNSATTAFEDLQKTSLLNSLNENLITQEQYNTALLALSVVAAEKRLSDASEYASLLSTLTFNSEEEKKKYTEEASAAILKAEQDLATAVKAVNDDKEKVEKDYLEKLKAFRDKFHLDELDSNRERYQRDLQELKNALEQQYLTQEEYEKKVQELKLGYAENFAQQAVQFTNYVADAVTSYHQFETESLEAEKQKQLSIAGDDKEKREQIEKEYAQKELDLKKKQANADAGVKIAQAVAGGALAVIQAYAQLGPVAGSVAAALVATSIGFEIASIKKQRDAIMATTLDSSGDSSSSSGGVGARVVTDQAASGRYDVIGNEDGKTYRNVPYRGVARTGIVGTPTLVAEQGEEVIIDNPTLRNLRVNAPHVLSSIMKYRVNQRAAGNYQAIQDPVNSANPAPEDNTELLLLMTAIARYMEENNILLSKLINDPIYTYMILDQFEATIRKRDLSLKKGSL